MLLFYCTLLPSAYLDFARLFIPETIVLSIKHFLKQTRMSLIFFFETVMCLPHLNPIGFCVFSAFIKNFYSYNKYISPTSFFFHSILFVAFRNSTGVHLSLFINFIYFYRHLPVCMHSWKDMAALYKKVKIS